MNDNRKSDWKLIVGGIALIAVLFVGVNLVFWMLGEVIRGNHPEVYQSASVSQDVSAGSGGEAEAPGFCVHCGKALPDSFRWGQFCPYCGEKVE